MDVVCLPRLHALEVWSLVCKSGMSFKSRKLEKVVKSHGTQPSKGIMAITQSVAKRVKWVKCCSKKIKPNSLLPLWLPISPYKLASLTHAAIL